MRFVCFFKVGSHLCGGGPGKAVGGHCVFLQLQLEVLRTATKASRPKDSTNTDEDPPPAVRRRLDLSGVFDDSGPHEGGQDDVIAAGAAMDVVLSDEDDQKVFQDSLPKIPGCVARDGMTPADQRACRIFMGFAGRRSSSEAENCTVDEFISKLVLSGPRKQEWRAKIANAQAKGDINVEWTTDYDRRSRDELAMALVCWYYLQK